MVNLGRPRDAWLASWRAPSVLLLLLAFGSRPLPAEPPALPSPAPPSPTTVEERLRRQDELIQQLIEQNRRLGEELRAVSRRLDTVPQVATPPSPSLPLPEAASDDASKEGGAGARANPADIPPTSGGSSKQTLKASIGRGLEFATDDDEFVFQVHTEIQTDLRAYTQSGQHPGVGGFDLPRERLIFMGRLTKPIEYDLGVGSSYGSFSLVNAFLNFHYDDRLMVKLGRYNVPYLHEFYAVSNVDLIQPERSLYGINFGLRRQVGAQVWGQLQDKTIDYAVGVFNGPRNDQIDYNTEKDVIAYLNLRPFEKSESFPALKWWNLGGSFDFGNQDNPLYPTKLRTSVNATNNGGADETAPPFLTWNRDVRERGDRAMWAAHSAFFYKQLSLIAEWQGANIGYAKTSSPSNVRVPVGGFYVTAGYFLTGEEVTRRTQVKPKRPFDPRKKSFGLGAFELTGRYTALTIDGDIFTQGLADQALWTNRVGTFDLGLNWYLNDYVKFYLDWQHDEFASPVQFAPGRFQLTSDLFWIRGQIYY